MEAVAKSRHLRSSAIKIRIVAKHIRNQSVNNALLTLETMRRRNKGAYLLHKTVASALANFRVKDLEGHRDIDMVRVRTVEVDEGTRMKRVRPHAQGRAFRILKKFCHITVVVSD